MPIWRCPHCGTPQAESARCWVCHRSTTSCATCLHFRRGIAGGLGLCGLDPRRSALDGSEIRACWAAPDPVAELGPRAAMPVATATPDPEAAPHRTFVPVDEVERTRAARETTVVAPSAAAAAPASAGASAGWSLWGDAEG
jgi:hypothetical protein